ncbi:MAG: hypothetical protein B6243_08550 [Anaerolineaceae bacterium 4572_5.2]|nr:MAG: hypothetical protein B6243_08550 [Anaerolineaceae bacterium 4572_5.2]
MGGALESPAGTLKMPLYPASAAGPDLREMILGSEGRMGVLTEATVKVSPLPERDDFHAIFFPDWERAVTAARRIIQAGLPLSMLRLSSAIETETTLALAGHKTLIGAMEKAIALFGAGEEKCMLLIGFTGQEAIVKAARKQALSIAGKQKGVHVGRSFGKQWHKNRFRSPYLRNALWEAGYAVDTLETAVPWSGTQATLEAIERALHTALGNFDERAHVFTHLSHVYPPGSTCYVLRVKKHVTRNTQHGVLLC